MAGTASSVALLAVCLVAGVAGRSDHVPIEACKSMLPGHDVDPQVSQPPYNLKVPADPLPVNSPVEVVLEGVGPSDFFKGFFVKAFDDISGQAIGSFTKAPKTIDCDGPASGAHHADPLEKHVVDLTWQPPTDYIGSVTFMATVVQTKEVFWVGVVSKSVSFA